MIRFYPKFAGFLSCTKRRSLSPILYFISISIANFLWVQEFKKSHPSIEEFVENGATAPVFYPDDRKKESQWRSFVRDGLKVINTSMFGSDPRQDTQRKKFEKAINVYKTLRSKDLPKTTLGGGAASFLDTFAGEILTGMKNLVIGQLPKRLYRNLFHRYMCAAGDRALDSTVDGGDDVREAIRDVVSKSIDVL